MITEDYSQTNPPLHELYTGWAMHHLTSINRAIEELDAFSNLNLSNILGALVEGRRELIDTNAAYRDAAARLMAGHETPPYHDEREAGDDTTRD